MRICFFFVPIVLALTISVFSQGPHPAPVFQTWNEVQVSLPLIKTEDNKGKSINRLSAVFVGNLRLGRKTVDTVDTRIGVALDLRLSKYVSLVTGVLYRRDEITKGAVKYETRTGFALLLSKTWHDILFRDRNQYEHRFRNGRTDTNFYRQRLQASYPLKYHSKVIFSPYVSEEVYFDLGAHKWTQSEFLAGVSRAITKTAAVDIAYLRNDSLPANVNGIYIGWKFNLR